MRGVDRLSIRDVDGGAVIAVKAVPGASRDRVVGVLGDALKIATSAPAEKGKANVAVAAILAKALGVQPGLVRLVSGAGSQRKAFLIAGMPANRLRELLGDR